MSPRAPKHCGYHGCTVVVYPPASRCDEHSSGWKTSPRTESSKRTGTSRWQSLRVRVLQRDGYQCQICGPKCLVQAGEVDHVIPTHLGGPDTMTNSQAACRPCHDAKTAREAAAARG
jgi:5-methylcytosine-specific restriction enzyme A